MAKIRSMNLIGLGIPKSVYSCLKNNANLSLLSGPKKITGEVKKTWKFSIEVLCNQLFDSAIVGGIAALSLAATHNGIIDQTHINTIVIMFGMTFLIKMKEYRKIDDSDDT